MYLTAPVQQPWIPAFLSFFIGQRQSRNVMIIDVNAPSDTVLVPYERS